MILRGDCMIGREGSKLKWPASEPVLQSWWTVKAM